MTVYLMNVYGHKPTEKWFRESCAPATWPKASSVSRFPGCVDSAHSEQVLGCFLLAAERMQA